MKTVFFIISILSFVAYKADTSELNVKGKWNGSYRTITNSSELSIVFGRGNRIELYSSDIKSTARATGSYTINNGNKLVITCQWPGEDSTFTLYGRLSPDRDFVNGEWDYEKQANGTFYLAKKD